MFDELDLHGYTVNEAKVMLNNCLANKLPGSQVTVVHGYSSKVLLQFVRKQYNHKNLDRKILTTNPGITIYLTK